MYNKRNIKNPWSPDAKNDFLRPFCIFTEYFLPFENNKFDIYSDCLSFLTLLLSSLNASYPLPPPPPKWERLLGYSFVIYRRRMKDTQTDRWSDRQRGKTVTFFYTLIESHAMEKLSYLHSINEQISNAVCYVTFFKVSVIKLPNEPAFHL